MIMFVIRISSPVQLRLSFLATRAAQGPHSLDSGLPGLQQKELWCIHLYGPALSKARHSDGAYLCLSNDWMIDHPRRVGIPHHQECLSQAGQSRVRQAWWRFEHHKGSLIRRTFRLSFVTQRLYVSQIQGLRTKELWTQTAQARIHDPSFTSCRTLSESLNLSVPQFPVSKVGISAPVCFKEFF